MKFSRQTERLQDEVYRQMLRLGAGCSAAKLQLALALLRAWMVLERLPPRSGARQWLRAVCPMGLRMMQAEADESTSGKEDLFHEEPSPCIDAASLPRRPGETVRTARRTKTAAQT